MAGLRFVNVHDERTFASIPPCADPRFDHRTCDYWEDPARGSKVSRPTWLHAPVEPQVPTRSTPGAAENPFAPLTGTQDAGADLAALLRGDDPVVPGALTSASDVLAGDDLFVTPAWNPFAPGPGSARPRTEGMPRKLGLLDRGRGIFGSYARIAYLGDAAVAYAQFGPLSAYPRARQIRELYPRLPSAPPPGVITCVATIGTARGRGHARALIADVCRVLGQRGFAAVEAYPDLTRPADETSAAGPAFWEGCGFHIAAPDDRFPVMRRELE